MNCNKVSLPISPSREWTLHNYYVPSREIFKIEGSRNRASFTQTREQTNQYKAHLPSNLLKIAFTSIFGHRCKFTEIRPNRLKYKKKHRLVKNESKMWVAVSFQIHDDVSTFTLNDCINLPVLSRFQTDI